MIRLGETDATGVLYFPEQFKIALETLEVFFATHGVTLHQLIGETDFLLPVVHAQGDYKAPLKVGDEIEIELTVQDIGTSAFRLKTRLIDKKKQIETGTTEIVHVAMSKTTRKSMPIPAEVLELLRKLGS